jgi:hypothetical protein
VPEDCLLETTYSLGVKNNQKKTVTIRFPGEGTLIPMYQQTGSLSTVFFAGELMPGVFKLRQVPGTFESAGDFPGRPPGSNTPWA